MKISKRTLPSIPGGLMNKAFAYTSAANTDVRKTLDRARGARVQHEFTRQGVRFQLTGARQA